MNTDHKTFASTIEGMIWKENPNGPINWSLEEIELTYNSKHGHSFHKCFAAVEKKYDGKYRADVPFYYDEETDSDCLDLGTYNTLEEAMKIAEQNINQDIHY